MSRNIVIFGPVKIITVKIITLTRIHIFSTILNGFLELKPVSTWRLNHKLVLWSTSDNNQSICKHFTKIQHSMLLRDTMTWVLFGSSHWNTKNDHHPRHVIQKTTKILILCFRFRLIYLKEANLGNIPIIWRWIFPNKESRLVGGERVTTFLLMKNS